MSEAFDLIKQRIEMTDRYHASKERMAWLASTLYYGFCLAIISVLLNSKLHLNTIQAIIIMIGSIAVFVGAIIFVHWQFTMRWHANDWTSAVLKLRANYRQTDSVAKCVADLNKYEKECARSRCNRQMIIISILWPIMFWKLRRMDAEYRTEIPSYGIATYLFLAEIGMLITKTLSI